MKINRNMMSITDIADELQLKGDVRTWFIQSAGLHQGFPRTIRDGILYADLEAVLRWFDEENLSHLLYDSGYYVDEDEDGDASEDDEHDDTSRRDLRRRR